MRMEWPEDWNDPERAKLLFKARKYAKTLDAKDPLGSRPAVDYVEMHQTWANLKTNLTFAEYVYLRTTAFGLHLEVRELLDF